MVDGFVRFISWNRGTYMQQKCGFNVETPDLGVAKIAGIFYTDIDSCLVYSHTLVTKCVLVGIAD